MTLAEQEPSRIFPLVLPSQLKIIHWQHGLHACIKRICRQGKSPEHIDDYGDTTRVACPINKIIHYDLHH